MSPELLDTLLSIAVGVASLIGILGGAWLALRKWVRRKLRPIGDAIDALGHMPEVRKQLAGISYYVMPNGGGSLADSSKRIEKAVQDLKGQVGLIESTSRVMLDTNSSIGTFECDDSGQIIVVNRTFARWLGVDKADLLGWGFLNSIDPKEGDDFREEWALARKEHREFRSRTRFMAGGGAIVTLEVTASPIPEAPPVLRWVGVLRMVPND